MRETITRALKLALETEGAAISKHIADRWETHSTGGIEKTFSAAFLRHLPTGQFTTEVMLDRVGGSQLSREGKHGFMDCVLEGPIGIEFKAMRLPRKIQSGQSGARYDLYQVVEDYCRIREAKLLIGGYAIIFVYGPLVADADTPGQLYRAFHNQLFVDQSVAEANGQAAGPEWRRHHEVIEELEFNLPLEGFTFDRSTIVVKSGALGAIGLPRDWQ